MAGVQQFRESSSAMMVSVKGTPCRSSSGAPSIWYLTSCRPFCRCSRRASHCGGTSWGSGRGTLRLLPAGSTGIGISPSSSSPGASASGGGAVHRGATTGTCSRRAAATTCWIALSKAGDSSSMEVSEEVLRRGGSATWSVTLGGRGVGGRAAGVEPVTTRERGRSCYYLQGLSAYGGCSSLLLVCCSVRIFHRNSHLKSNVPTDGAN
ncbi:UNVERIFIED_CONTAM: hypothetical protein Sradi_7038000 [Sesamum radiatum]|uniref:Uncharacterized protein n=1 Tax=Sesamum radiatum TaxID=300843 RepID=A0AAW2J9G2_SESRA